MKTFSMILVTLMSAQVLGSSVNITWDASSSPNVNYFVYRGTLNSGPYTKLNSTAQSSLSYAGTSAIHVSSSAYEWKNWHGSSAVFNCKAPSTAGSYPVSCQLVDISPNYFCPLTIGFCTVSVPGSGPTPAPTPAPTPNRPPPQGSTADFNANGTTKKLYSWWQGLISQTSKKVIQAALIDYRTCAVGGCPGYEAQLTAAGGNLSMAAIGGGYCNGFIGTGAYCVFGPNSDANVYAKQYWAAGGLVSISMHMNNPFNNYDNRSETCTGYPNCTGHPGSVTDNYCVSDSSIAAMLTPGGTYNCGGGTLNVNAHWNTELDQIANSLLDLQASGVTVIWRPMAEQNASWFWYGNVSGAVYQKLWKYMFNYFTDIKRVHNLLWDFSVNSGYGNPENTYPGDGYVDVVGEDLYSGVGPNDSFSWYSDFTTNHPTKPYGLDEVGPTTVANSYNYSNLIQAVHNRNPKTTWIMQWWNDGNYSIVNQLGGPAFMSDTFSITLKDVPAH